MTGSFAQAPLVELQALGAGILQAFPVAVIGFCDSGFVLRPFNVSEPWQQGQPEVAVDAFGVLVKKGQDEC